jgi:hypothetical protein
LIDTQEDLLIPLGACLWTFVLIVGANHQQKELMNSQKTSDLSYNEMPMRLILVQCKQNSL